MEGEFSKVSWPNPEDMFNPVSDLYPLKFLSFCTQITAAKRQEALIQSKISSSRSWAEGMGLVHNILNPLKVIDLEQPFEQINKLIEIIFYQGVTNNDLKPDKRGFLIMMETHESSGMLPGKLQDIPALTTFAIGFSTTLLYTFSTLQLTKEYESGLNTVYDNANRIEHRISQCIVILQRITQDKRFDKIPSPAQELTKLALDYMEIVRVTFWEEKKKHVVYFPYVLS